MARVLSVCHNSLLGVLGFGNWTVALEGIVALGLGEIREGQNCIALHIQPSSCI